MCIRDRRWNAWVSKYGRPDADDIRVDTLRTSSGNRRRYLVRQRPSTSHGHPLAWKNSGMTPPEVAAAALASDWPPILIIKFLNSEMGVPLGEAKIFVDKQLPEDTRLANAQLRAVAEFALHLGDATDAQIEDLEAQTNISKKIRGLVSAGRQQELDAVFGRFDVATCSFAELSLAEARRLAEEHLDGLGPPTALEITGTSEHDFGWLFSYQSANDLRTRNFVDQLGGNGPILVDRFTATLWPTGSAFPEEVAVDNYRKSGNPTMNRPSDRS